MAELMAAEVTDLAGPKGKPTPVGMRPGTATRPARVTLGGRRLAVQRPRVRTVGEAAHALLAD